jgi:benzoate-CoA ligase family protein
MAAEGATTGLDLPRRYNAANHFIDRHVAEGRGGKIALTDDKGRYSYADLALRVNRAANLLKAQGVQMEQRVLLCLLDGVDFVALFWGAIKMGAVPVPANTLLATKDYDYLLRDSRARLLVASDALLEKFRPIVGGQPFLEKILVAGTPPPGAQSLDALMQAAGTDADTAPTTPDDVAFWLYSSGSTGQPKGTMHMHGNLAHTAVLYAEQALGTGPDDVSFSAAKLFFAYGLGNAMTFPLHVGGSAVVMAERPTPAAVMRMLSQHQPTVFYGVPTLYAAILADPLIGRDSGSARLRLCVSAGEALPEDIGRRWKERFGVDILDGIGSTEMLHIFLSNRPGDVRLGTTGKAVPGYRLRIVDDQGRDVAEGEIGELLVSGPSSAIAYWNNRAKSLATFQGAWTRTGDKYTRDGEGYYHYCGRSDDMLKVGGIWVSPFEVESALAAHPKVLEAAVVGRADSDRLIKPQAYVVLKPGESASPQLAEELQGFVKARLAPYKYPRWIAFLDELPKTPTGKIQRFKLRQA